MIVALKQLGVDQRGASFSVPLAQLELLGAPKDVHLASIGPGHVRGNHYHVERRELIVVLPHERWSLHWDVGEGTDVSTHTFFGQGAVAIAIPPSCAHAIRNDGSSLLWLIASTDGVYDPTHPDAYRRVVTRP
jgi:dTDP-4-dehydrorhamnose 3,5-epimerase-like enzyme